MKLKITPYSLICIVLVQLVFIDACLIAFFMKEINKKEGGKQNFLPSFHTRGYLADNPEKKDILKDLMIKVDRVKKQGRDMKIPGRIFETADFIATTYDLSYESCGKYPSHPAYGITFSGKKAVKGRTIAVDPEVIPLGSSVYIEFPPAYAHMNGWYVAEDTGGKVKGNIVDVFLGESAFYEMEKFGSRKVSVKIAAPAAEYP